jgi:hypothetical protein
MGKILLRCAFGLSLILLPLTMLGQSGSAGMGQSGASMSGQDVSATGCLQKGQETGGYYLTDENGKTWELMGSGLAAHVGHKVTVTGHTTQASKTHETKVESAEKAEAGSNQRSDLKVTDVKMVSTSCQ